jgi:hypothetical protein
VALKAPDTGHTDLGSVTGVAKLVGGAGGDFVGVANGNIDNDSVGMDGWFISSQSGTITSGTCAIPEVNISEGVPGVYYNDVDCDN